MKHFLQIKGMYTRKNFIFSFLSILFSFLIIDSLFTQYKTYIEAHFNIFLIGFLYLCILFMYVFCAFYIFISVIKRLRNIQKNTWLSLLVIVPILNILFIVYLCIAEEK